MRSLASFLCAFAGVFLVGCGSVGEPLYPALNIPTRVSDLAAVERGPRIDITFTIPALTTEGLVLKSVGSLEVRVGPSSGDTFQLDQWAAGATRVDVPPPQAPGPVVAKTQAQQFAGKDVVVAVRVANAKGRMSEWSNLVVVSVEAPLATPAELRAEAVAEGVRLTWIAPNLSAFRILRKVGEAEPSMLATAQQAEYVDPSTEYGKTYEYYVAGIHDKAESDLAGPATVTPQDKFPPKVPSGLTASAGIAAIELAWERNTEPDFKEYRVFRSTGAEPFVQIADGVEAPSYSDRKIESGKQYRYRIVAIDQTGNPSEASNPVEIIAP